MSREAADRNLGKVLAGRYRLVRDLGAGQMARVYVAEQIGMGRNVAVKLLLDEVQLDDVAVARFTQEVFAVARLRSPHTIQFYDAGASESGAQFIAMELLAGETLRQRLLRDERIPPHEAVGIAAQVGASLQEAHEAGVLHRDLK
ncbi:MAG TPA: protein kinase, partial [Kofleriaceae bacterium]|nr:protein kinase [Kofleriaceae bacterium]